MILVLLVAAIIALAVWAYQTLRHGRDLPSWLVTVAARWIPADRREWSDALVAEFPVVRGATARWAYAAAALRMAALPPARRPLHLARTAGVAAICAVTLSTAALLTVPTVAPFVVTLAILLAGYVTVRAGRSIQCTTTASCRMLASMAVAGIAAIVAVLWVVAIVHPSATTDHAHVLSTMLAVALTGYLASALRRPTLHADTIGYSATAGATCLAGITAFTTLAGPDRAAVSPMLSPAGIGVCLMVAFGVAVKTGNGAVARRAGILTVIVGAPLQFAVTTISLLTVHSWSLTTAYDEAAYPRSGYPDVASYVISDAIGGHIIAGILIGPLILGLVVTAAATVGARLRTPGL